MAAVTLAQVRQRFASALMAAGWRESPFAADNFPGDAQPAAHKSFSVVVSQVQPITPAMGVRGRTGGCTVNSTVSVRFLFRVRADGQVDDYDSAMDEEQAGISAILATSNRTDLHISFVRSSRQLVDGDGTWCAGSMEFLTTHTFDIGG